MIFPFGAQLEWKQIYSITNFCIHFFLSYNIICVLLFILTFGLNLTSQLASQNAACQRRIASNNKYWLTFKDGRCRKSAMPAKSEHLYCMWRALKSQCVLIQGWWQPWRNLRERRREDLPEMWNKRISSQEYLGVKFLTCGVFKSYMIYIIRTQLFLFWS